MVPSYLIVPPLLVTFVLTAFQYYRIGSETRVRNTRFILMLSAIGLMIAYPLLRAAYPDLFTFSLGYFVLALVCLALSFHLLRRMPPRKS